MSCQNDSNNPTEGQLLRGGSWVDPSAIGQDWVHLVAGQYNIVGKVYVVKETNGDLTVTYVLDDPDCEITQIHLDLASQLNGTLPMGFHVNDQLNPQIGLFDFTEDDFTNNSITIPKDDVLAALGVGSGFTGKIYVGAHAEVCCPGTEYSNEGTCPDFQPEAMTPYWLPYGQDYTVKVDLATQGTYYGFCVDAQRYISSGMSRFVNFICSYSPDIPTCSTFIELPENLDLINWIINNRQLDWDKRTLQAAIWQLTNPSGTLTNWSDPSAPGYWNHNATLRQTIVDLAYANGEGFVPDCNQKVIVLAWSSNVNEICTPNWQVVFFEVPVECVPVQNCETAWGFIYPPSDGTSALFPGHVWFRYFGFNY